MVKRTFAIFTVSAMMRAGLAGVATMRRTNMIWLGAMLATAVPTIVAAQTVSAGDVKLGVDAWARGDYTAAVDKWRPSALAGDPDAQFNLGQAYKLGRGVPVDPALAESWFRKAALQGHEQAETNYGIALFEASGGRALAEGTYLQRAWRDAHAGRVHAANDPERALQMFGAHEFGHKIDPGMY